MLVDPFVIMEHRFRLKCEGSKVAEILRPDAELIGAPAGVDFTAYQVGEVPADCFQAFDVLILRDYDKASFLPIQCLAWRMLKRRGWLYFATKGSDYTLAWRGWKLQYTEPMQDEVFMLYQKVVPDNLPFHVGTHQDTALFSVKKTQRQTKRAPEKIGEDKVGYLVKWYLLDCTLYLKRPVKGAPYVVFDIGPAEPAGAGANPK